MMGIHITHALCKLLNETWDMSKEIVNEINGFYRIYTSQDYNCL